MPSNRGHGRAQALLGALVLLFGISGVASAQSLVIEAPEVFDGRDRLGARRIVIEDGRITQLTSQRGAADTAARHLVLPEGAWVLPGLCLADSVQLAPSARRGETLTPEARAGDAYDPFEPRPALLRSGVTAVWASPGRDRFLPGRGSVLAVGRQALAAWLLPSGAPHCVVTEEAYAPPEVYAGMLNGGPDQPVRPPERRFPRSRAGAFAVLRRLFAAAAAGDDAVAVEPGQTPVDLSSFRAVLAGELPLRVRAELEEDIREALQLAERFGFRLIIEGGTEAHRVAGELARLGAGVILRAGRAPSGGLDVTAPFTPERGEVLRDAAAQLAAAGVRVALVPPVDAAFEDLLWYAAQTESSNFGMDRWLRAVTADAARLMGLPEGHGRVMQGGPADLVILDRAPSAPGARPLLVVAGGQVVHDAMKAEHRPVVIEAKAVHVGDGTVHRPGVVVVRDGKILAVGGPTTPIPAGARRVRAEGELTPGFVALGAQLGIRSLEEEDGQVLPGPAVGPIGLDEHLVDAFDAARGDVVAAAASGVTSFGLVPRGRTGVAGRISVVKTRPDENEIVRRDAGVYFDLRGARNQAAERSKVENFLEKLEKDLAAEDAYEKELKKFEGEQAEAQKKAAEEAEKAWPSDLEVGAITRPVPVTEVLGTWTGEASGLQRARLVPMTMTLQEVDGALQATIKVGESIELVLPGTLEGNLLTLRGELRGVPVVARARLLAREGFARFQAGGREGRCRLQRAMPVMEVAEAAPEKKDEKSKDSEGEKKKEEEGPKPPKPPKRDDSLAGLRPFFMAEVPLLLEHEDAAYGQELLDVIRGRFEMRTVVVGSSPARGRAGAFSKQEVAYATGLDQLGLGAQGEAPAIVATAARKVMTAFFPGPDGDPRQLYHAAAYAVRQGLPPETALASLTRFPALILGVQDRVGTLEVGRDADLVLLDGQPFAPATQVARVMVSGRFLDELVEDAR